MTYLDKYWLYLVNWQDKGGLLLALVHGILGVRDGPLIDGVWESLGDLLFDILNRVRL